MPETSAPRITGTDAERQLDDTLWRDMFGDEAGVIGDYDGSAYKLTLPTSSNVAQVGSTTQASLSVVGGFRHRIPAGETQSVTVPAIASSARTDIIAARLDLATFTGAPGPVRLVAIEGTSTNLPVYDDAPPGIEDLPLWAITRQSGQSLSQGSVTDLRNRISRVISVPHFGVLPQSAPLGYLADWKGVLYRRTIDSAGNTIWVRHTELETNPTALDGSAIPASARKVNVVASYITTVGNTAGGFNVQFGFTFTKLIAVKLTPGDRVGGLGFIVPVPANFTTSSAHGVAYQPGGAPVPINSTIRVEVNAVGYVL